MTNFLYPKGSAVTGNCASGWLKPVGSARATCRIGDRARAAPVTNGRVRCAKTISVALSKEQYEWLKTAIANWRRMQETIKEMQKLSRQVLFATVPNPPRRKRLGKRVLGLI